MAETCAGFALWNLKLGCMSVFQFFLVIMWGVGRGCVIFLERYKCCGAAPMRPGLAVAVSGLFEKSRRSLGCSFSFFALFRGLVVTTWRSGIPICWLGTVADQTLLFGRLSLGWRCLFQCVGEELIQSKRSRNRRVWSVFEFHLVIVALRSNSVLHRHSILNGGKCMETGDRRRGDGLVMVNAELTSSRTANL